MKKQETKKAAYGGAGSRIRQGMLNLRNESAEQLSNPAKLAALVLYLFAGLAVLAIPPHALRMREKAEIELTLMAAFAAAWTAIGAVLAGRELEAIKRMADDKELAGAPNHIEGLRRMRQGQARLAQAMLTASNYCAKGTLAATVVALLAVGKIASVGMWDAAQERREKAAEAQHLHEAGRIALAAGSRETPSAKR